jgi:hypothetical protein
MAVVSGNTDCKQIGGDGDSTENTVLALSVCDPGPRYPLPAWTSQVMWIIYLQNHQQDYRVDSFTGSCGVILL